MLYSANLFVEIIDAVEALRHGQYLLSQQVQSIKHSKGILGPAQISPHVYGAEASSTNQ